MATQPEHTSSGVQRMDRFHECVAYVGLGAADGYILLALAVLVSIRPSRSGLGLGVTSAVLPHPALPCPHLSCGSTRNVLNGPSTPCGEGAEIGWVAWARKWAVLVARCPPLRPMHGGGIIIIFFGGGPIVGKGMAVFKHQNWIPPFRGASIWQVF